MSNRVDFFVAGVQKAGTTALDTMLRAHPNIQMASQKEVHFFDNENLDWLAPDLSELHCRFDWNATQVVRGESTPIYTYWRDALRRLKTYNPQARIIVGLRHPTFRAYSHWRMETARNCETLSFADAISSGRSRVSSSPSGQHRVFSYVERGDYAPQIAQLRDLFRREQLHFFRTDALWAKPDEEVERIERFLGVEPLLVARKGYISPIMSAQAAQIDKEARTYLDGIFRQTIDGLSELTGLDVEDWKRPDYVEPMTGG